ncbi:MAG: hypothetical protein QXU20_00915 [Candidatus Woesearchaeota archaeon]
MNYDDFMKIFELEFDEDFSMSEELLNLDKELTLKTKRISFLYPAS